MEPCARLGLDMKLPPHVIPRPYTRLAFEGWFYACEKGKGEEYNDLIYRAYFMEEQDIGELEVLTGLARRVGLDADDFAAALQNGSYTAAEKEAVAYARNVLKPQGVPTIYINGEKISVREYTKEEMIAILRQEADKDADGGFSCGGDGCGFSCGDDGCGMA